MSTRQADEVRVPVAGGALAVTVWRGDAERSGTQGAAGRMPAPEHAVRPLPVLAAHGITANGLSFAALADALGDGVTLIAPDLRGRGASSTVTGPYGLAAHAADLITVLDHLGYPQAVLTGHSMGAFVATLAASRHPERFSELVLVDGGLGLPLPPDAPGTMEILEATLGPAVRRLDMTFENRAAYHDFYRAHPAFADLWSPYVEAFIDRDLIGEPPHMRSSCVREAVRADGAEVLTDPETLGALHRITVPTTLLWAERGLLDDPPGLYDEATLAAAALDPARVRTIRVPDTNHYSILLSTPAATTIATAVTHTPPPWDPAGHEEGSSAREQKA